MVQSIFPGKHETGTREWWVNTLTRALRDRENGRGWSEEHPSNERGVRPPLKLLDAWRRNEPPLPLGASQEWATSSLGSSLRPVMAR